VRKSEKFGARVPTTAVRIAIAFSRNERVLTYGLFYSQARKIQLGMYSHDCVGRDRSTGGLLCDQAAFWMGAMYFQLGAVRLPLSGAIFARDSVHFELG
jgi:hypothetical protein